MISRVLCAAIAYLDTLNPALATAIASASVTEITGDIEKVPA